MVGKTCSVSEHVKGTELECTSSHCIIHCQALAVKKIPNVQKTVFDKVVKIINFIESRPLY
jgi:hypothetical protein